MSRGWTGIRSTERSGIVRGIIGQVRLRLRLRKAILLWIVCPLAGGHRRVLVLITGHARAVRRCASRRHERWVSRCAREVSIALVPVAPLCRIVAPLSNIARIPTTICREPRVGLRRSGIVTSGSVEECRVISCVIAWHSSRKMLARCGIVLRRVGIIATGSWLGAREVAGLAVIWVLAIWMRHRGNEEASRAAALDALAKSSCYREQASRELCTREAEGRTAGSRKSASASSKCGGRGQVKSCREAAGFQHSL